MAVVRSLATRNPKCATDVTGALQRTPTKGPQLRTKSKGGGSGTASGTGGASTGGGAGGSGHPAAPSTSRGWFFHLRLEGTDRVGPRRSLARLGGKFYLQQGYIQSPPPSTLSH